MFQCKTGTQKKARGVWKGSGVVWEAGRPTDEMLRFHSTLMMWRWGCGCMIRPSCSVMLTCENHKLHKLGPHTPFSGYNPGAFFSLCVTVCVWLAGSSDAGERRWLTRSRVETGACVWALCREDLKTPTCALPSETGCGRPACCALQAALGHSIKKSDTCEFNICS